MPDVAILQQKNTQLRMMHTKTPVDSIVCLTNKIKRKEEREKTL